MICPMLTSLCCQLLANADHLAQCISPARRTWIQLTCLFHTMLEYQTVYLYISYMLAITIGTRTDLAGFAAIRIMLLACERCYGKTLWIIFRRWITTTRFGKWLGHVDQHFSALQWTIIPLQHLITNIYIRKESNNKEVIHNYLILN